MKFRSPLLFLVVLFISYACKQAEPVPLVEEYELIWSDEFTDTTFNTNKWTHQTGTGSQYGLDGWGNNEQQYYRPENTSIQNGVLTVTAKKENYGGMPFTSSRFTTSGKNAFKYGKIECRMRTDKGQGVWSAFWMLPQNPSVGWPRSGEIDVMEFVGHNENEVFGTVHYGNPWGFKSDKILFPDLSKDFHTYTILWEENKIEWLFDNTLYHTFEASDLPEGINWPFNEEFYLLLNMAIGGNLTNNHVDGAIFPVTMDVDYVRVYKKN